MTVETTDVLGVMSGSSMDGLDLAFVRLHTEVDPDGLVSARYELLQGATLPIPESLLNQLTDSSKLDVLTLLALDREFGMWAGREISSAVKQTTFSPVLLGFHGHTVFHFPERLVSFQLGHGATLSMQTQLPVVTDFRSEDLVLGGQGAPMVAIAEKWLWPGYSGFLNLGGICNLTLKNSEGAYLSADLWVCNQILNHLAREMGLSYDDRGQIAAGGRPIDALIEELRSADWFGLKPPKSLDNSFLSEEVLPIFMKYGDYSTADKMHSAVVVIGKSIAHQIKAAIGVEVLPDEIMVTGGGVFNDFLIAKIREELSCRIVIPDLETVQYKEAIMVAFAGWLRWRGLPNFIKEATGARLDSIGGAVHVPAVPEI